MGREYEIKCSFCSFISNLNEGTGKLYSSLDNLIRKGVVTDGRKIKKILKKFRLNQRSIWKKPAYEKRNPFFEKRIYRCRKCGGFESQIYIRICVPEKWMFNELNRSTKEVECGKILYRSKNKCPECNIRLRHVKGEKIESYPCPECGNNLKISNMIPWE